MNILLVDIDATMPNLALLKVELYHRKRGDEVLWGNLPLWKGWADKIYVSCLFTENREECLEWEGIAEIGGTGYDLTKKLPPEIESMKPHINYGFTTRGCTRNCPFCCVPRKEGKLRIVGTLLDLWDGRSRKITLLDNNILGVPDHFGTVCEQAREHGIFLDFNQGLDFRLLTQEIVLELKSVRHKEYRFAFDFPDDIWKVGDAINLLQANGLRKSFWYVLVGFNTSFEEDLMRLNFLRGKGQTAFVQRYSRTKGNRLLSQWANRHAMFKAVSFDQFLKIPRYARFLNKYQAEILPYFGDWYASLTL